MAALLGTIFNASHTNKRRIFNLKFSCTQNFGKHLLELLRQSVVVDSKLSKKKLILELSI
jgi:hypothetical protein